MKLCIFDFDGTLVSSMERFSEIAAEVLMEMHRLPLALGRQKYKETSGLPFFQQLEILFPDHPKNREAAESFESRKLEKYYGEPLEDGAPEIVTYLHQKKIRVAVSSNNFQEVVEKFLTRFSLPFDRVLGFRKDFAKGRDHFRFLQGEFGLEKNEMIFVGDSLKDAEQAAEESISFIGKTGIFSKQDFQNYDPSLKTIAHLRELQEIL